MTLSTTINDTRSTIWNEKNEENLKTSSTIVRLHSRPALVYGSFNFISIETFFAFSPTEPRSISSIVLRRYSFQIDDGWWSDSYSTFVITKSNITKSRRHGISRAINENEQLCCCRLYIGWRRRYITSEKWEIVRFMCSQPIDLRNFNSELGTMYNEHLSP